MKSGWGQLLFVFVFILLFNVDLSFGAAYIVKSSAQRVIDGSSQEWTSTATHPIVNNQQQAVGSFRAEYDDDNLYFLLSTTTGPKLGNAASFGNFPTSIFSGDAGSICIGPYKGQGYNQRFVFTRVDEGNLLFVMRPEWPEDPLSHPYVYYTEAHGAYQIDYLWHLQEEGGQVNFSIGGSGWAAEVAIPWSVLGYKAADNDLIPFDIEIIVGDPSGSMITQAAWWFSRGPATATEDIVGQAMLYPTFWGTAKLSTTNVGAQNAPQVYLDPITLPRGVPISFSITNDALLTTVNIIHKETDFVYREMIKAKRLSKGDYTYYWDGFDREERIVPAGEYRVVVAQFPKLEAKFLASIGNSASPPYSTADGRGSYGGQHYGPSAVATDETGVFILHAFEEGRGGLRRIDPATGKAIWVASIGGAMATTLAVERGVICTSGFKGTYGDSDFFALCFNSSTGASIRSINGMTPGSDGTLANGMAIVNSTIYLSIKQFIQIAKPNITAKTWTQQNITIPGLRSLCRYDANTLLLVFDDTTLRLYNIITATVTRTWATDTRLRGAVACTRRLDAGDVYVTNNTHVLRYNSNGQFVSIIGKGLRPYAEDPFDPAKLRNAQYIAVGPDNNLYVTERGSVAPYRFVVFSATTGKWVRDYYGPIAYNTVIPDIDNPEYMYYIASKSYPALVQCKVNYTAYSLDSTDSLHGFQITAIYLLTQNGIDTSLPDEEDYVSATTWGNSPIGYGGGKIFRAKNGMKYLFLSSHRRGAFVFLAFDEVNKRWKPKTAVSWGNAKGWQDLNNDGLVNNATELFKPIYSDAMNFYDCDRDFTVYSQRFIAYPRYVDENGVPRFDGNATRFNWLHSSKLPWGAYWQNYYGAPGVFSAQATSENATYASSSFGPGGYTTFWDRAAYARFVKIKDGKVQWVTGSRNAGRINNGDITYTEPFAGEVDGVACVGDIESNFVCYSSDGLALGYMVGTASYGDNVIQVENAAQASFFKAPDGKRMLLTMTTGDARILEMVGPFGKEAFTKTYQLVNLTDPELRRYSGPNAQKRVFDLQYITQGDGRDGTFYNNVPNADGFDWEWSSQVSNTVLRNPETGKVVAEVRMRRDAGELNLFMDVIYSSDDYFPFFPRSSDPEAATINSTMFGNAAGFEIMIGPSPNGRTNAQVGDTRIFITGVSTPGGPFTGYALAVRPGAPRIFNSTFFNSLDKFGNLSARAQVRSPIFTSLTTIPGAVVGIMPRYDGLGYQLEASIPLALVPEVTQVKNLTFRRFDHGIPTGSVPGFFVSARPDLDVDKFPISFNFALHVVKNGVLTRIPWVEDGFSGKDPSIMNPSQWGVISPPATVMAFASKPSTDTFVYFDSSLNNLDFHKNKMAVYSMPANTLVGATYFTPDLVKTPFGFFNKSFVSGFSIENGIGQTHFQTVIPDSTAMRNVPFIDITAWGINNLPKEQSGASGTNASHTIIVKTNFATGVNGLMHVLWGTWSSNNYITAYLSVKESRTGKIMSGLNATYPTLLFPNRYYTGFRQARDTTFIVGGKSTYEITVTDGGSRNKGVFISAVWITSAPVPSYHSPATISFVGDTLLGSPVDIETFNYYVGDNLVAQANPSVPAVWANANAGQYQVQPVALDRYTGQTNSSAIVINILGPVVAPISPTNGSKVFSPVSLSFSVSQNGPAKGEYVLVKVDNNKTFNLTASPYAVDLGSISDGRHVVSVYALDDAGDYSQFEFTFESSTAPTPPPENDTKSDSSSCLAHLPFLAFLVLFFFL